MPIVMFVAVACSVLFYRAAERERMSPFIWGMVSMLLTSAALIAGRGVLVILAGQAALFLVMWWYNASRRRPR